MLCCVILLAQKLLKKQSVFVGFKPFCNMLRMVKLFMGFKPFCNYKEWSNVSFILTQKVMMRAIAWLVHHLVFFFFFSFCLWLSLDWF